MWAFSDLQREPAFKLQARLFHLAGPVHRNDGPDPAHRTARQRWMASRTDLHKLLEINDEVLIHLATTLCQIDDFTPKTNLDINPDSPEVTGSAFQGFSPGMIAVLGRAHHAVIINMNNAKALAISKGPFVIVEQ